MAASTASNTSPTRLKKQLGVISSISYITGSIIGVGIFISPSAVLEGAGSDVGVALLIWTICGALTFCAAMCYAEYGTRIKKSGGTYTYIKEAYGELAGFVFLWDQIVMVRPMSLSLLSLATAEYLMRPVFLVCPHMAPRLAKVFIALVVLSFFMTANFYSVKLSARLQVLAMVCKVAGLVIIIIGGIVHLAQGHNEHFSQPFQPTDLSVGGVALGVYAGLYAYGGWDNLNIATEEVIKPQRTIPTAILFGLGIPTLTYILANVAYHAVLTNNEILSGVAVAVMFGERKLEMFKWLILPCVAISAGGSANGMLFTASRLNFVGGRDGLMPRFLGMINVNRRTPQPSILLLFIMSVIVVCLSDVKSVLGAYTFFKAGGEFIGVCGIFRIRRKYPTATYQVPWVFPVIYMVFFGCLSVTAIVYKPSAYLVPAIITLLGVPVFYVSKSNWWRNSFFISLNDSITWVCQRLLLCEFADKDFE